MNTFGKNLTNFSDSQGKQNLQNKLPTFKNDVKENSISAFDRIEMKSRLSQLEEEIQNLKETQIKSILASANASANLPKNDTSRVLFESGNPNQMRPSRLSENLDSFNLEPRSQNFVPPNQKMPQFGEYNLGADHVESFDRSNRIKAQNSSISKYLQKGDSRFFSRVHDSGKGFFDSINSSFYQDLRPKNQESRPRQNQQVQELFYSKEKIQNQENQIKLLNERISQLERASQSQAEYLKQKTSLITSSIPISPQRKLSPIISRESINPKLETLPTSQSIHMKTSPSGGFHLSQPPQSEYSYLQPSPVRRMHTNRVSHEYHPMTEYMSDAPRHMKNVTQHPVRRVYHKDPNCPRISHGDTEIITSNQMQVIGSAKPQRRSTRL